MIGRRTLLTLIGLAPVAGRTTIPDGLTDKKSLASLAAEVYADRRPRPNGSVAHDPESNYWQRIVDRYLNPEDVEDKYRRFLLNHRLGNFYAHTSLDPDLAANKSFSLVTKARMQRDREFVRQYNRDHYEALYELNREDPR